MFQQPLSEGQIERRTIGLVISLIRGPKKGLLVQKILNFFDIKGKWCACCKDFLPRSQFGPRKTSPDGLEYYCRTCRSEKMMAEYQPYQRKKPQAI
jgi:hypothetical protein